MFALSARAPATAPSATKTHSTMTSDSSKRVSVSKYNLSKGILEAEAEAVGREKSIELDKSMTPDPPLRQHPK